jgi:hypothetical protein
MGATRNDLTHSLDLIWNHYYDERIAPHQALHYSHQQTDNSPNCIATSSAPVPYHSHQMAIGEKGCLKIVARRWRDVVFESKPHISAR